MNYLLTFALFFLICFQSTLSSSSESASSESSSSESSVDATPAPTTTGATPAPTATVAADSSESSEGVSSSFDVAALVDPICDLAELTDTECASLTSMIEMGIEEGLDEEQLLALIEAFLSSVTTTTAAPTVSTTNPTAAPTVSTAAPSSTPTAAPTVSTAAPSSTPTVSTAAPTASTLAPSAAPTASSSAPTGTPSSAPTGTPSSSPVAASVASSSDEAVTEATILDVEALVDPLCESNNLSDLQCDELKVLVELAAEEGQDILDILTLIVTYITTLNA